MVKVSTEYFVEMTFQETLEFVDKKEKLLGSQID